MQTVHREDVLNAARQLAETYGDSLTLTAFRRETSLSQWAIFDLFGSWRNLRMAVGLTPESPRVRNRITRDCILKLFQQSLEKHGPNLTENRFLRETGLSGRLIADRFGSWAELRATSGLSPRAKTALQYTDDQLIDDLYRVYERRLQRPRYHSHRRHGGKISAATIQTRFGSWKHACAHLKARLFCEYSERNPTRLEDWEPPKIPW